MGFETAALPAVLCSDQQGPSLGQPCLQKFLLFPSVRNIALPCRYSISRACCSTSRAGRPLAAVAAEVFKHSSLTAVVAAAAAAPSSAPLAPAPQQQRSSSSIAGSSVRPPWLGAELDIAGFTKRGFLRGGGKPQNQDRGLIIEQFRSEGEVLVGVMDGHGTFGHLVSSYLVQHLPAVLLHKLVAAAAALLPGPPSSSSRSSRSTDSGQQQPMKPQKDKRKAAPQGTAASASAGGGVWDTQMAYVVVPHYQPTFSSSSSSSSSSDGSSEQQQQHGKRVIRHKVLQMHPHNYDMLAADPTLNPYDLSSSSTGSSTSSGSMNASSSSSSSSNGQVAVPAALVNQVPLTPLLLNAVFSETDHILSGSGINVIDSGSTGLLCHIGHDAITTAWVGDSRAILGRKRSSSGWQRQWQQGQQQQWQVIQLSDDHKPERPDEQLRICLNNGRVQQLTHPLTGEGVGPWRVWFKDLDYPGLAMSRAFGDLPARRIGVTAEPELYVHRLEPSDLSSVLVAASDGVWEYMDNEEVMEVVTGACDDGGAELAARRLVEAAESRWRSVEGGGYIDDITVVVVRARPRGSKGR